MTTPNTLTSEQYESYAHQVIQECLIEAGDDVEAGYAAAEIILSIDVLIPPNKPNLPSIPSLPISFSIEPMALSIDVQGREHKPKGVQGAGQFVSKNQASKLTSSPFTFQSPLSDEHIAELDDLIKELDDIDTEPKISTTKPGIGNPSSILRSALEALSKLIGRKK